jgi:hypothetical protein
MGKNLPLNYQVALTYVYQMAALYSKWPLQIPNGLYIYQIAVFIPNGPNIYQIAEIYSKWP